jgi:sterol desaturase/sphingolipid hydroxylase (fatty acid hydroxylase superfamily)
MIKYVFCTLLAVATSFLLHEFSHWVTGEALGYHMIMTLNKVYPRSLSYTQNWHYTLISAVGPIVTLLQALTLYLLIRKNSNQYLYPFLFSAFFLELLSGIMNFRRPNDLGRISQTFGLGLFTIPLLFVIVHFFLIYKTSNREGYLWKVTGLTFLLVLVFSSIWILANQRFHVVIIP